VSQVSPAKKNKERNGENEGKKEPDRVNKKWEGEKSKPKKFILYRGAGGTPKSVKGREKNNRTGAVKCFKQNERERERADPSSTKRVGTTADKKTSPLRKRGKGTEMVMQKIPAKKNQRGRRKRVANGEYQATAFDHSRRKKTIGLNI